MTGTTLGHTREIHDSVPSTMDLAAAAARAGAPDGHVVVARRQTAGRGRAGRSWYSGDGGLYLSAVIRGFDSPAAAGGLTLAAGVGVAETVRQLGAPHVFLKWPNDVLLGERKVAGILTEWVADGAAVVGVGLNVAQAAFPPELAPVATSIALATGRTTDPTAALEVLLGALGRAIAIFRAQGLAWVVPEWSRLCGLWGRRCVVAGIAGIMLRLDPDGALVLQADDGTERRSIAGTVELR